MNWLKGKKTIISGILIILAGGILQYNAMCQTDPAELADVCAVIIVPGWLVSTLGMLVVWCRKVAKP